MSLKLDKNTEFKVEYINNRQEWDDLLNSKKIVVCDFTATWCGPCIQIGPEFVKLAENYSDNLKVEFFKIDVDKNEEVSALCEIECMPTFQVWYNGNKVDTWEGGSSEILISIRQTVESLLK